MQNPVHWKCFNKTRKIPTNRPTLAINYKFRTNQVKNIVEPIFFFFMLCLFIYCPSLVRMMFRYYHLKFQELQLLHMSLRTC